MLTKSKRTDFFPNYMSWRLTGSTNAFLTERIHTPIPRISGTANRATVMELLWLEVEVEASGVPPAMDAAAESYSFGLTTGPVPAAMLHIDEGNVLCHYGVVMNVVTTGGGVNPYIHRYNWQTTDGFGILLAADSFHAYYQSLNFASGRDADFRLYYRLVEIGIAEYIGITQSQQTS
jgi:hypothetical protein